MPFLRAERYLAEAVDSVLAQKGYDDWRLYLINDGSDEGDVPLAKQLCRRYSPRITLLEHPDGRQHGSSASRNLGIRQSRGQYIAFLDADDVWYPHKLQSQVKLFDAMAEADMLYGSALRWWSWNGGEDVHVPSAVDGYGADCLVPGTAVLATFLRDEGLTPCTGSVLIRRSALERCGYFEDDFADLYDDQVLYSKLCLHGDVFVSSDCVSRYRQHANSSCARAHAGGKGVGERTRFLQWLGSYRRSRAYAIAESAVSPG